MSRHAFGIAVIAGPLCLPVLAQTLAEGKDTEKEADRAAQAYAPVRLWERPDVRATRVEIKPMGYTRGASA